MTRLNIQAGCFFHKNHVYYTVGYPEAEIVQRLIRSMIAGCLYFMTDGIP